MNIVDINAITPLNPPHNFFPGILPISLYDRLIEIIFTVGVPGIGELMLSSFLPPNFYSHFDANSWYQYITSHCNPSYFAFYLM